MAWDSNEAPRSKLCGVSTRNFGAVRLAFHPCSKSPTRHSLGDGALQGIPAKANKSI